MNAVEQSDQPMVSTRRQYKQPPLSPSHSHTHIPIPHQQTGTGAITQSLSVKSEREVSPMKSSNFQRPTHLLTATAQGVQHWAQFSSIAHFLFEVYGKDSMTDVGTILAHAHAHTHTKPSIVHAGTTQLLACVYINKQLVARVYINKQLALQLHINITQPLTRAVR